MQFREAMWVWMVAINMAPFAVSAQAPNSWINFSQTYYKIPVANDGIYRLTYTDLQAAGVPLGSIDPRGFNLYHRGVEQAIIVTGQSDAVFDPSDVIEFYGHRNDGTLDTDLYDPPSSQPHTYYNLFSDTTAYFLTWNPLSVLGKRAETFFEVNAGLPVQAAHQCESLQLFTSNFVNVGELQSTTFSSSEGWSGPLICTQLGGCTGQQDFSFEDLLGPVTSPGTPSLDMVISGRDDVAHNVEVYAGANAGALHLVGTANFFGFDVASMTLPLTWPDIGPDGRMTVRVKITPTGTRDLVSVAYLKVTMTQDFDARSTNDKVFRLLPNPGGKSYIEIQNPVASAIVYDISDPANLRLMGTTPVGGGLGAVVDNTTSGRTLLVTNSVRTPVLKRITFRSIAPSHAEYVIISHQSLLKPGLAYSNPVEAYAAYRSSPEGGGYDTLTVTIDQLYNQFNYGETSPRAIFQFMKFLDAGGDPRFLFLIGKGMEASHGYHRKTSHAPGDFHDLVPPAGVPGSDMTFTAGLNGAGFEPGIPVGRLTASTPAQVAAYLNKVKESEATPFDALWRKNLLHLSGGIQVGEPQLFRTFVDGFKAIAEDHFLGGQVGTISKQTLNVELINVKDQVNDGLSLITFYGHSGPGTIDIDIGYVSDPTLGYQNQGKYPGFLINGCNAGRFFDNRVTFGEDWMLTANKGATSFIAHSSFGFLNALKNYSDIFYQVAFGDSVFIHKGVGEVQQETGRRYLADYGSSLAPVTQVQQMVLLGDPAVSLFGANHPDYEISAGGISLFSFEGGSVNARMDSFAVEFRVRNFGRTEPTPLHVRVERTLGDGSVVTYDSMYAPVFYEQILRMVIYKGDGDNEAGNNLFTVVLDVNNNVDELSESNNSSSAVFFVPSNGARQVFPPPFAIVEGPSVELSFQHSDLTSDVRDFILELDTTNAFNSPYLTSKTVSAKGLGKWSTPLLAEDSLAYYWRTRLATPLPGESSEWTTSSFTRISSETSGWAQVRQGQWEENDTLGLSWNGATQRLEFLGTTSTVDVLTYGIAHPSNPAGVSVKINGEEFNIATQGQLCRNHTLNLIAFDKSSSAPYGGVPFSLFDPRNCGREPQLINSYERPEMDLAKGISTYVANVKPSDSVVLFSIGDPSYALWSPQTFFALAQLGISSTQLNTLQPGEPFIILGKKGSAPGTAEVIRPVTAPLTAQSLSVNTTITGRYSEGTMTTGLIGPATTWGKLATRISEKNGADSVSFDVFGVDLLGAESLVKNVPAGDSLLQDIDANQFPYLRLLMHTSDTIDLTPAQLHAMLVTFTPVAEGVVTYDGTADTETVQEGEPWSASYGFTNISSTAFPDSLTVRADVFTRIGRTLDRQVFRIKAPAPGDTTHFTIDVDTRNKGGVNDVTVYVNPRVLPETYYDNNILPLYEKLYVEADLTGPVLDVTIDGRHVVNGDEVSASPLIRARVIDHNPFLLKSDTTGVDLFLRSGLCPDGSSSCFQRIAFTDPQLSWLPATPEQEFQVTYQPNLEKGLYILRVQAVDANGNSSGEEPYEVSFAVGDEIGLLIRSVYPNPSSEFFNFSVFVGGQDPDDWQLDIFTATGLPVQTFSSELQAIHAGTNELRIPAADAQGNLLPPGIFVYRFTATIGGQVFRLSGRLAVVR